jgi:hypothetical protein
MTLLRKVISKLETKDTLEQLRTLCERIYKEEMEENEMEYIDYGPEGPNIFLCLQVPGHTTKHVGFLTLERESEDLYLSVFWALLKKDIIPGDVENTPAARKMKVWEIKEYKTEKILTEYAKTFKLLNGE